eukprot:353781-Chlamydomonas_euryale.AAC.1
MVSAGGRYVRYVRPVHRHPRARMAAQETDPVGCRREEQEGGEGEGSKADSVGARARRGDGVGNIS